MRPEKRALTEKANFEAPPNPSTLTTRPRRTAFKLGFPGGVYPCILSYAHTYIHTVAQWRRYVL